jgi:hypothetical protein
MTSSNKPTELQRVAMRPRPLVLFLRSFVPYQMLRFVWINFKMVLVIWKSHG